MILVVDDDVDLRCVVRGALEREGFAVDEAGDGALALTKIATLDPELVVLDLGLPDVGGLDVLRAVGSSDDSTPVIVLSGRGDETDRIVGLELGADDYVTKPFSPPELVARVKAVLRRADSAAVAPDLVQLGDLTIDAGRREVRVADEPVAFTGKEFELLKFLADRPGLALSRQQILDGVWGHDWFGDARTVDVHIAQVRKKVAGQVRIDTVRGVGYRLDPK